MGPEGVVGRHVDFDGLVEGVELAILRMVVVAPVGEHVAWVGDGLHFNGARVEIHAVPGVGEGTMVLTRMSPAQLGVAFNVTVRWNAG